MEQDIPIAPHLRGNREETPSLWNNLEKQWQPLLLAFCPMYRKHYAALLIIDGTWQVGDYLLGWIFGFFSSLLSTLSEFPRVLPSRFLLLHMAILWSVWFDWQTILSVLFVCTLSLRFTMTCVTATAAEISKHTLMWVSAVWFLPLLLLSRGIGFPTLFELINFIMLGCMIKDFYSIQIEGQSPTWQIVLQLLATGYSELCNRLTAYKGTYSFLLRCQHHVKITQANRLSDASLVGSCGSALRNRHQTALDDVSCKKDE